MIDNLLTTNGEIISSILGYVILVIVAWLLLVSIWLAFNEKDVMNDPQFLEKWGAMYKSVKYENIKVMFHVVYQVRGIIFVATSIYLKDHMAIQVMIIL